MFPSVESMSTEMSWLHRRDTMATCWALQSRCARAPCDALWHRPTDRQSSDSCDENFRLQLDHRRHVPLLLQLVFLTSKNLSIPVLIDLQHDTYQCTTSRILWAPCITMVTPHTLYRRGVWQTCCCISLGNCVVILCACACVWIGSILHSREDRQNQMKSKTHFACLLRRGPQRKHNKPPPAGCPAALI